MVSTRSASYTGTADPTAPSSSPSPTSSTVLTRAARASTPGRGARGSTPGSGRTRSAKVSAKTYTHTPPSLVKLWLAVSLPLVAWDTGYVLGRPATMPGGWAHSPLWTPYALYGTVDYVYGIKAWEQHDGFTGAQGMMNLVETVCYCVYLGMVFRLGETMGSKEGARKRVIRGRAGAVAVLICFTAAVMTLSKTVLYWLNEYYSGFSHIGHNDLQSLISMWIIPNGFWLVAPTYMICRLGSEIIDAMAGLSVVKRE